MTTSRLGLHGDDATRAICFPENHLRIKIDTRPSLAADDHALTEWVAFEARRQTYDGFVSRDVVMHCAKENNILRMLTRSLVISLSLPPVSAQCTIA